MKNRTLKENCKQYQKRIISGLLALVMMIGMVPIHTLTAGAVELSEEHANKNQVTVTPTFQEGNGAAGFYFTTTDDPLAYATNWSLAYGTNTALEGAVYVDGQPTDVVLKKIAAGRYYVALSDSGKSGVEGRKVVIDATHFDAEDVVTFKRTHFIYESGAWKWDMQSMIAEKNQVSVSIVNCDTNATDSSASLFYFRTYGAESDPLLYDGANWSVRYGGPNNSGRTVSGGVYKDGELTNVRMAKISADRYAVLVGEYGLSGSVTEGTELEIQGVFYDEEDAVTIKKATFVFDGSYWAKKTDNYYDITDYRKETVYTYPTKEGQVFAGWYEDEKFTIPLGQDVKTGNAYAKFIDDDTLSVKLQSQAGTTGASSNTYLRFVTTVDSYNYNEVGFDVTINGKTAYLATDTAYTTLYGYTGNDSIPYQPSIFSSIDSNYFCVKRMTNIPNNIFDTNMVITPKWKTLDGTVVTGITRTVSVSDGIVGANFAEGVTFELGTESKIIQEKGAVRCSLSTVSYSEAGIEPLNTLGAVGLKGSKTNTDSSTGININLGKTYPAGTKIRYWIYIEKTSTAAGDKTTCPVVTWDTTNLATKYCNVGQWVMIEATFAVASSTAMIRIDVGSHTVKTINYYLDNIQLFENTSCNFEEGITFERAGEESETVFEAIQSSLSIVSYSETGIEAPSTLGAVALKGAKTNSKSAAGVNINLGKEYSAGTKVRYWVYIDKTADVEGDKTTYPVATYDNTQSLKTVTCNAGEWSMIEVDLTATTSVIKLRIDVNSNAAKTFDFYLDNIQMIESDES